MVNQQQQYNFIQRVVLKAAEVVGVKAAYTSVAGAYYGGMYGGMIGRNQDLTMTKYGAALAYILIEPCYSSINLRSDVVGRMPWRLVSKDGGNEICSSADRDTNHPLARAIFSVRRQFSDGLFKLWQASLDTFGDMTIEYVANPYGYITGLRPLNSLGVEIDERAGQLIGYWYQGAGDGRVHYVPQDVVYDKLFNPQDDLRGHSPTFTAIQKANVELNVNRTWNAFFRNGARPDLLMQPEAGIFAERDMDVLRQSWRNIFKGTANAGTAGILPIHTQIDTFDPPDLEHNIVLSDNVADKIYRVYRVPSSLTGGVADSAYQANVDTVMANFVNIAIRPSCENIQDVVNGQIVPRFKWSVPYRFEFVLDDYEQIGDAQKNKVDYINVQVQGGFLSLYDAQVAIGNPSPDEKLKDIYLIDGKPVPVVEFGTLWRMVFGGPSVPLLPESIEEPIDVPQALDELVPIPASPATPAPDEKMAESLETTEALNGAQIAAALSILEGLTNGTTAAAVALELLLALGIKRERAQKMVEETERNRPPAPIAPPAPEPVKAETEEPLSEDGDEQNEADALKAVQWVDDTKAELAAWQKFALRGGYKTRTFEPEHCQSVIDEGGKSLADIVSADIKAADGDGAIKAVFDAAFEKLPALKAIDDTISDFERRFNGLLSQAQKREITRLEFTTRLRYSTLPVFAARAYIDGMQAGGVDDAPDEDDQKRIDELLSKQGAYTISLAEAIYSGDGLSEAQEAAKATLWVNKSLKPFYYAGVASADRNGMYMFAGDDGKESCITCRKLKGQIHRMKDWQRRALQPGVDKHNFICGGWQCQHNLVKVKSRARGNWLRDAAGKWA
jgi:HK97 family phage portal protein